VSMQMLPRAQSGFHLRRGVLRRLAQEALRNFDVRPADPGLACSSLSGGNQQKVLMAKWLQTKPAFLIVHEPTQGVDVGAREEIYRVVREAAEGGMAVLCASSDHEQLAALCDRVVVFRQGRVGPELAGDQLRKETISQACYASFSEAESSGAQLDAIVSGHEPAPTPTLEGKS
jgi:ribose transport system ATP-binding protein